MPGDEELEYTSKQAVAGFLALRDQTGVIVTSMFTAYGVAVKMGVFTVGCYHQSRYIT